LSEAVIAGQTGHVAAHNDIHDVVNEAARYNVANTFAASQTISNNGGKTTLALTNTTADVGITIGGDTSLYRSAADTLKTDDNFYLSATGSSVGSPRSFGISSMSAGQAARLQFDDVWTVLQTAAAKRMQLVSYWGLELRGGRIDTNNPGYITGTSGDPGVSVLNDRDQLGLLVKGFSTQTSNLQQWQSSAGVILTSIDSAGKLVFGPSGSQDTVLYRSAANELATDDIMRFNAAGTFQTTVGAAGGGDALPATPTKYLKIKDEAGTTFVVPCYAAA
jgi:hypothetical protein